MEEKVFELINESNQLLQQGQLQKAYNVIKSAYDMYPEYLIVNLQYAKMINIQLHVYLKVAGIEGFTSQNEKDGLKALELLQVCRDNGFHVDNVSEIEESIYYKLGQYYEHIGQYDRALYMLNRTDTSLHPWASVVIFTIHDTLNMTSELSKDTQRILDSISSQNWENKYYKAGAFWILSSIFVNGGPGVPKNVEKAYYYIQQCASLDYELAESELKRYTKNIFGKISYR